ncbi:hypothetical protein SORBI_3006G167250 [Sorghum bicolor]|uniref:Uncharacterized protein n=1 Tax=Sorghum bicolor TaxID=4558 RepID=A0A1Z5RE99_SORBI|nr:hypothetical protein SORBI_3006G167250 [Sorghum bicolor]
MIPANCMHTQWVVTQDFRSVICFWSSWMFLPSFSCPFLFLTCLRRQYVRSSSNQGTRHLSLPLNAVPIIFMILYCKWLQTRHLMSLWMS